MRQDENHVQKREDDFEQRRKHLTDLSDEELMERFWQLTEEVVEPLVDLARENTSPSIERSVLLRMGFSSVEAKEIVDRVEDHGLLGKGAGHIVYKIAKHHDIDIREAGLALADGQYWDDVSDIFNSGGEN